MPSPSILALYAVTAIVVLLVPGPAVLFVVSQSLRQGRRAGIASVLGIHAGTLVQVLVAVLGGSALLLTSALTFSVVKYLGAAYLVYLGVRKLLGRDEPLAIEAGAQPMSAAPVQVATFGIVFVLLGLCTDGSYAVVAGTVGPWLRGHARLLRGERYVVGTTFIGLGVAAALTGSRRTR